MRLSYFASTSSWISCTISDQRNQLSQHFSTDVGMVPWSQSLYKISFSERKEGRGLCQLRQGQEEQVRPGLRYQVGRHRLDSPRDTGWDSSKPDATKIPASHNQTLRYSSSSTEHSHIDKQNCEIGNLNWYFFSSWREGSEGPFNKIYNCLFVSHWKRRRCLKDNKKYRPRWR